MTNNVETLPRRYQHLGNVKGKEVWAQPEPSDEMVWEICANTKGDLGVRPGHCLHCPKWETHKESGLPEVLMADMIALGDAPSENKVMRGCRAMAEHISRVAHAVISKGKY